jgi:hypothetical protein
LLNWASAAGTGESPWVYGHYFALTDSGTYAYLCKWGNGNHAMTSEINQAHGVLGPACANGPGIFQWNEWKKGIGLAATGQVRNPTIAPLRIRSAKSAMSMCKLYLRYTLLTRFGVFRNGAITSIQLDGRP